MRSDRPSRFCLSLFFHLLPFASLFFHSSALAFNAKAPMDISADMIDYTDADQAITAEGHVIVIQGTATIKADWMRYEQGSQRMFARGHVFMNDHGAILLGESMSYDLNIESGTVTGALGYQKPWLFSGPSWQKDMDYFVGRDMSFTSCDLLHPHYHVRSSSIHLVPGQHFWAWNNLAYADDVPVFYTPFIYKSLEKQRVVIRFEPGHDSVNGNFVKTQTTLRLTDAVYDKVFYDYYSEQGNGLGNELNYKVPGKVQGSLFGYYINPRGDPALAGAPQEPQYNFRSYHWEKLSPTATLQSNVNVRQNVSFNNQYFPQDTNQSVNDLTSSVALTSQKGHINQRLVVEALQAPDATDTSLYPNTHIQNASLPRYDFTLYQIPIWNEVKTSSTTLALGKPGPLTLSANATVGDQYQRLDEQMHPNSQGSVTLSQSIPLSRHWSFTPTLTPQFNWQDKFDAQPPPPVGSTTPVSTIGLFRGYQGRLATADTFRWRPMSALTLDNTYSLTERMEPNGVGLDRGPTDGGVETHHVNWLLFWRPSRRVLLRSFSGYDLREIADEDPNLYLQRKWDPWTTEYTYTLSKRTDLFFRYALGFYPFHDQLWETDYQYRGRYNTLLQTGLLYNNGLPGTVTWNNNIGLALSPGWRVDTTIHLLVPSGSVEDAIRRGGVIDDEFIVTRDLHCWQAQFVYRNIPPLARTYSLQFNLKLGVKAEKDISDQDLETQYYPWRSRTYAN